VSEKKELAGQEDGRSKLTRHITNATRLFIGLVTRNQSQEQLSLSLLFFSPQLRVQIDALIEHYIYSYYIHAPEPVILAWMCDN